MMLPNRWSQGSLFAFSGLDGENTLENSLVGTLSGDRLGVIFNTLVRRELAFALTDVLDIDYQIVASDIIKMRLLSEKTATDLTLLFYSQDTVVGSTGPNAIPYIASSINAENHRNGDLQIHGANQEYTAFLQQDDSGNIKFAFSFSHISPEDAITKVETAITANLSQLASGKIEFFSKLPQCPSTLSESESRTLAKCFSVMKSQVYTEEGMFDTRWTTPDRVPHSKLWLWDSVFHSLGNRYISRDLAIETISAVFSTQREDGFIPHMADPKRRSDVTQPPVLAWGLYNLSEFAGTKDILSMYFEPLQKYLEWNMANRDSNKNHLYEWKVNKDSVSCRCDECGMDNSPRFDNVTEMDCIDFSCFMANEARYMAEIAEDLGKQREHKYWDDVYQKIKNMVNDKLWDEKEHFHYDRKLDDGKLKKVKAVSSFLPLFAGLCDSKQARHLVSHLLDDNSFNTEFPVPSIAVDDSTFGTDMWRGPVWINYNYLIILGLREYGYTDLAEQIRRKTLAYISFWYEQEGSVYEFYDSQHRVSPRRLNRKGAAIEPYDFRIRMQSIRDYGWTCSLFAALACEKGHKAPN